MGWHPGAGPDPGQLGRLQRRDVRQHPRARLADSSGPADLWEQWTAPYPKFWRGEGPTRRVAFAPLFGHQYSQIFIDFRGIRDAVMRKAGFDYFENSRRETYANRAYCVANPMGWRGYSEQLWGLTACDGPGDFRLPYNGRDARNSTAMRRADRSASPTGATTERIAPTAALGSLPFAPEIVIPCAEAMMQAARPVRPLRLQGQLQPELHLHRREGRQRARSIRKHGWVAKDYLGIDQGPILLQAANYRDDFVWRYMRRVPAIRRGLERAGFTGGWLSSGPGRTRLSFETPLSLNASIATQ